MLVAFALLELAELALVAFALPEVAKLTLVAELVLVAFALLEVAELTLVAELVLVAFVLLEVAELEEVGTWKPQLRASEQHVFLLCRTHDTTSVMSIVLQCSLWKLKNFHIFGSTRRSKVLKMGNCAVV